MADFNTAQERVADWEGAYQVLPQDSGNYNSLGQLVGTNWGINAKVYESWIQYPPTISDMMNMPLEIARLIFKLRFWDKIKGDDIQNQFVANIFYDGAVNHGVSLMTKFVQRILGVNDDGIVGPITLGAINSANPADLYNAIKQTRIEFYQDIVDREPDQEIFLNGWLNRINSFNDFFLSHHHREHIRRLLPAELWEQIQPYLSA